MLSVGRSGGQSGRYFAQGQSVDWLAKRSLQPTTPFSQLIRQVVSHSVGRSVGSVLSASGRSGRPFRRSGCEQPGWVSECVGWVNVLFFVSIELCLAVFYCPSVCLCIVIFNDWDGGLNADEARQLDHESFEMVMVKDDRLEFPRVHFECVYYRSYVTPSL